MNKIAIEIFGNTYTIKGEGNEEYVKKLAKYVDDRMVEISQASPAQSLSRIAILSALNIADDYYQSREDLEAINKKSNELADRIENILQ